MFDIIITIYSSSEYSYKTWKHLSMCRVEGSVYSDLCVCVCVCVCVCAHVSLCVQMCVQHTHTHTHTEQEMIRIRGGSLGIKMHTTSLLSTNLNLTSHTH